MDLITGLYNLAYFVGTGIMFSLFFITIVLVCLFVVGKIAITIKKFI